MGQLEHVSYLELTRHALLYKVAETESNFGDLDGRDGGRNAFVCKSGKKSLSFLASIGAIEAKQLPPTNHYDASNLHG